MNEKKNSIEYPRSREKDSRAPLLLAHARPTRKFKITIKIDFLRDLFVNSLKS